jgi:hypothetical protein
VLILVGTGFAVFTAAVNQMLGSSFFRPFGATSQISYEFGAEPDPGLRDPSEPYGSTWNVVISPNGWGLIVLHYCAVILYKIWKTRAVSAANALVAAGGAASIMESGDVSPAAENKGGTKEPASSPVAVTDGTPPANEKEGEGDWPAE